MSKLNGHFNAFYEDNALLIQFIIVEFIQIHQLISQAKTFIDAKMVDSFDQTLSQLIGLKQSWTKGPLTKFKEYCKQLSNNCHQDKQSIHLYLIAHKLWLAAIHAAETHKSSALPQTLQLRFHQLMRYLPRVVSKHWNNENVILCLLRRKTQLSNIYGSHSLHTHFKWPKAPQETSQLLIQRYQERGFETLIPMIQHICS